VGVTGTLTHPWPTPSSPGRPDPALRRELATWARFDPHPLRHAAHGWAALAADLDRAADEVATRARDLTEHWTGAGARAAQARLRTHVDALDRAAPPARRTAQLLSHHLAGLAALQQRARDLLAGDPDTVTEADCAAVLLRLRELDRQTAAAIRANQPPLGLAAPVDRTSVAAQRGRRPDQVRDWWLSLTAAQREQTIRDHADLIGWLDGVSAADRDRANRLVLARRLVALREREADLVARLDPLALGLRMVLAPWASLPATGLLLAELAQVRQELAGLRTAQAQLDRFGERALLLGIAGGGDGRAVIALGDPDHARHTAVFVPGVGTDLADLPGGLDHVDHLQRAADRLTGDPADVATVYWLGYDAPGATEALSWDASRAGGVALTAFVDGLRATHDPTPAHLTLVGHSYGSTVVAEAALAGGLRADDLVAAGSPGMHTAHAADLHLDPRHVWGGVAPDDRIGGDLGSLPFVHGEEPTDPAFGGNRYTVDTRGHSGYWDEHSTSLANQAAIVVGRYDLVRYVFGAPPETAPGLGRVGGVLGAAGLPSMTGVTGMAGVTGVTGMTGRR